MKRFKGNETVAPGLYFNLRQLSFKSMEHEGRLPGTETDVYHGVPWFVLLFAGPIQLQGLPAQPAHGRQGDRQAGGSRAGYGP